MFSLSANLQTLWTIAVPLAIVGALVFALYKYGSHHKQRKI